MVNPEPAAPSKSPATMRHSALSENGIADTPSEPVAGIVPSQENIQPAWTPLPRRSRRLMESFS